jgi:hypothetical protein
MSSAHSASQNALTADPGQLGSKGRDATGTHAAPELSASHAEGTSHVLVQAPQRQLSPPPHERLSSQRRKKLVSLPGSGSCSRVLSQLEAQKTAESTKAQQRAALPSLFDVALFMLGFTDDALPDISDDPRVVSR